MAEEGAPNSSITTTVSLSDGLLSLTHSASEEVNQGAQAPHIGQGLLNIALAYDAVEEEEDLHDVQPNAEEPQNVNMVPAEQTPIVVAVEQQNLQTECAVSQ